MKKLIFQMESILISQINQKNVCSVTIGIFQIRALATGHFCDGCYNMMQKCNKLKSIAIIHIKESVYRIYFLFNCKREAKKLLTNLIDKKGISYFFFHYIKMDNTTYYQRNREIMLNRAKDYYENDKERLREQARNKYRNLSEEDKNKKRENGKNRYHNMSEEKKQELREHQKRRYRETK